MKPVCCLFLEETNGCWYSPCFDGEYICCVFCPKQNDCPLEQHCKFLDEEEKEK